METRIRRAIIYVGNDYACVENTIYDTGSDTADAVYEKNLRTLPVDNLMNVDGIKIPDMAGENGTMAMENAITEVLINSGYEGIVILDDDEHRKTSRSTGKQATGSSKAGSIRTARATCHTWIST